MKLEISEIRAPELLELLSAMNYFDVATLLAEAYAMHAEKRSDVPADYKYLANKLVSWCEPLIFVADTVIDTIKDAEFMALHPEINETQAAELAKEAAIDCEINEILIADNIAKL